MPRLGHHKKQEENPTEEDDVQVIDSTLSEEPEKPRQEPPKLEDDEKPQVQRSSPVNDESKLSSRQQPEEPRQEPPKLENDEKPQVERSPPSEEEPELSPRRFSKFMGGARPRPQSGLDKVWGGRFGSDKSKNTRLKDSLGRPQKIPVSNNTTRPNSGRPTFDSDKGPQIQPQSHTYEKEERLPPNRGSGKTSSVKINNPGKPKSPTNNNVQAVRPTRPTRPGQHAAWPANPVKNPGLSDSNDNEPVVVIPADHGDGSSVVVHPGPDTAVVVQDA
jgi:hypothetical protein